MAKSNKILLALQFWKGDMAPALKLAQFLADLEPKHSDFADFILVRRFDLPEPVEYRNLLPALSRKFNLYTYRSPRRGMGWPNGCNDLWLSTMEWVSTMIEAKRVPAYKAIFTFEADGGPIFQDWVERMSVAWDSVNKKKPVYQAGPMVKVPREHINGNCLMSCDPKFTHWVTRKAFVPVWGGWDFFLASQFKEWGWANIFQMRSYYNSPTFTREQYEQMVAEQLIWVHGIKDDSLVNFGRERFRMKK